MLESLNDIKSLQYQPLTAEEKQKRGILGRLFGPVADVVKATRNGRKYSEELWEKAFENPTLNEYFEQGGLPLEFPHSEESEINPDRIAAIMPEKPKKGKDGKLWAIIDILDTPLGKIASTLANYGYKLGISSRGNGELETDYDGNESVIPDSYNLTTWDLVLLPAVKEARLAPTITEGLSNRKSLTEALNEQLASVNEADRKLMTQTLESIDVNYNPEKDDNIDNNSNTDDSVDNDQEEIVKELQEALKQNQSLQLQIRKLQEKLSVCYTKDMEKDNKIAKQEKAIKTLSESCKTNEALIKKINSLTEQLNEKDNKLNDINAKLNKLSINEDVNKSTHSQLVESIDAKNSHISDLKKQVKTLSENLNEKTNSNNLLESEIQQLKIDSAIKNKEYNQKLTESKKLVEKYKSIANKAVDRYIDSKASMLGVHSDEIKRKLGENYSFNEIDNICESLVNYQLNISNLPFRVDSKAKVKVNTPKEPMMPNIVDDTIDNDLFDLAGLN